MFVCGKQYRPGLEYRMQHLDLLLSVRLYVCSSERMFHEDVRVSSYSIWWSFQTKKPFPIEPLWYVVVKECYQIVNQ